MIESTSELQRRIDDLERDNAALRAAAGEHDRSPAAPVRRKRGWGRALLATVLIVLGALLAPFAVVSAWAAAQLTDTDRFVAAYAPLASEPAVQELIADEVVAYIGEEIDFSTLTGDVIDGVIALGTGPAATQALQLLKGPAAAGVETLVRNATQAFVSSEAFANAWTAALRVSHTQVLAAMQGDPDAAITVSGDGSIGIQLGPIVDAVKSALLDRGISIANNIPAVDRTIVVAQSDAVPTVRTAFTLISTVGLWLPWIALALLAGGVLAARRHGRAVIAASLALAGVMLLLTAGFVVGSAFFVGATAAALPPDVAQLLYDTVVVDMQATTTAVLVVGVAVALIAWLSGPQRVPRALRGLVADGSERLRRIGDRHHLSTGRVGEWVYAQRVLLRVAIGVIATVVIVLNRPLTVSLVVWTLVVVVIALAVLQVVQRPPGPVRLSPQDGGGDGAGVYDRRDQSVGMRR